MNCARTSTKQLSLHTTALPTTGSRKTGCNCGISTVSTRRVPELQDLHNHDDHRINRLQLGNLCGLLQGTKGNVLCAMTG